MRVIVVNIMMGLYRGGGENFDLNLSRELAAAGHEVELYYLRPLTRAADIPAPPTVTSRPLRAPWLYLWTVKLHGLPVIRKIRGLRGFPRMIGQIFFELRAFFALYRRRHEDFVVWICGLSLVGALVSRLLGKVCYVRFPGPPSHGFQKLLMRQCHTLVANGDAYRQIARLSLPGPRLLRLEVGVDHSLFYPWRGAKRDLGLDPARVHLLWVGRAVPIKNLPLLQAAIEIVFERCSEVDLLLVGEGPMLQPFQDRIVAKGWQARVHLAGTCTGKDLARYYQAADIFVLSSAYDNFPNVVIEAMACGLPVVACAVGGVDLQVEDGVTGFLTPPQDAAGMAGAILRFVRDEPLRRSCGQAAIERAQHYRWAHTTQQLLDSASRALDEKAEPGARQGES